MDLPVQDVTLLRIIYSVLVLIGAAVLIRVGRQLIEHYVDNPERRYRLSKYVGRGAGFLAFLLIVLIWSPGLHSVFTVLTVIGAGFAIALRETLLSFAGWLQIATRSPYSQGDRIEVSGVKGDVVDIRLFHTVLMEIGNWVEADQSTGRIVHVPNSYVFQHPVYNYTHGFGFIWDELALTVTYRSDWSAAREIMLEMAKENLEDVEQKATRELRRLSREYLVHYNVLTPFVYAKPVPNGICLSLRFLCEARKRRGTEHNLTLQILKAFKEHGQIEIAYPTPSIQTYNTPHFGPMPEGGRGPGSDGPFENRPPPPSS